MFPYGIFETCTRQNESLLWLKLGLFSSLEYIAIIIFSAALSLSFVPDLEFSLYAKITEILSDWTHY